MDENKKMRIFVVCSYALSSSLLADKMNTYSEEKGEDVVTRYIRPDEVQEYMHECDVVLLSPQVRFNKTMLQQLLEPEGIPVIDLPMQVYGLADAKAAIALARKIIEEKDSE
jgi:cellobiose PTS system EIIB component